MYAFISPIWLLNLIIIFNLGNKMMVLIWPMPMFILGFAQGSPPKKNTIPCKWPTWIQMVDEPLGKYQIIIIKSRCHIIFPNKTQYFMAIVWLLHCFFNGFLHFHPCPRALKKRPPPRCTKGQRLVQYRAILGTSCIVVTCFIPSGLLSNKTMYMYNMHIYIYIHTYIHIRSYLGKL